MEKFIKTKHDEIVVGRTGGATGVKAVNPLLIALIFVVTMALPAFLVVQYAVKPRRQLALAHSSAHRRLTQSEEGSVIVAIRASQSDLTSSKSGLLKTAKPSKEQLASALDHQVEDTIRKLILMS